MGAIDYFANGRKILEAMIGVVFGRGCRILKTSKYYRNYNLTFYTRFRKNYTKCNSSLGVRK